MRGESDNEAPQAYGRTPGSITNTSSVVKKDLQELRYNLLLELSLKEPRRLR